MNIVPNNQTVEKCLKQRTYYIDFYQREYVWDKKTVFTLLDDIFYSFELAYQEHKGKDITAEVISKYNWYYLNIYITNTIEGKEYIVDGQQRLTTLCLIAIKLFHLANADKDLFENIIDTLKLCVFGKDKYKGNIFWIDNEKRGKVMQHLLDSPSEIYLEKFDYTTEENIINRYKDIDKYFEEKNITDDKDKLNAFILYFLERLVLVELKIEKDDTPMVFEVINDRGEALKPFEILKGKLIGALSKDDTEKYSELWEVSLNKLRGNEDSFFVDYLKGKYIYKRNAEIEKLINNEYHRYIFSDNEIARKLGFRKQDSGHVKKIKSFIENDLIYYSELYAKIKENKYQFLHYNNAINELSGQYQNILAACELNDTEEQAKFETISKEIDRLYILLQLNGIYDSNEFAEIQYNLNQRLSKSSIQDYRNIYDTLITESIKESRNTSIVNSLLEYDKFILRDYSNMKTRLLRYFFARVEQYICENMGVAMANTVYEIATKTGHKTGYHIEHIFSRNDENKSYFESEEEFESKRNRLGALLLLFNRDNISSGNEEYKDKLKTYSNGLNWGKTLVSTFYHSNKKFDDFNNEFKNKTGNSFKPLDIFDKESLEYRSKLLYDLVKEIWDVK